MSAGKEVKLQGVAPGTYELRLTFKLSGEPGTLSFLIGNITIKPKTKTAIDVTLYDYQVMIDDSPASLSGMASYETDIDRCKTHTIQDIYTGTPVFYEVGKHDKPLNLAKVESKTKGQIKPALLPNKPVLRPQTKAWRQSAMII